MEEKCVPVNLILGITLRWTSIPSRGSRNTPSRFMMGHLTRMQTLLNNTLSLVTTTALLYDAKPKAVRSFCAVQNLKSLHV